MLKRNLQQGFTLPEVIVAISVLATVLMTITGILVTVLRVNSDNLQSLQAYGYAAEGLEAVRAMRDSNWRLGLGFDGKGKREQFWLEGGVEMPANGDKPIELVMKKKDVSLDACNVSDLNSCLPFTFESADSDNSKIDNAPFTRVISISAPGFCKDLTDKCVPENPGKLYQVTSTVTWLASNGKPRDVILQTDLTDWQE